MSRKEQDITFSMDDVNQGYPKNDNNNGYSVINSDPVQNQENREPQEDFFYDELDRKCTLKKTGTVDSKIILHRSRTQYKGRRLFNISTAVLGLIGIILLLLFIIIMARGGWSSADFHDVSSANRITLFLVAIFIIFISALGLLGSYTYWKPIILMISLLSILGFVSHFYLAKKFLDITRFAGRDMAIAWWDSFTDEEIMAVEEKYNCCGYLNYKDHGFASSNCPKDLVTYEVPQDVYQAANVINNDSYKNKYWKSKTGQTANGGTTTGTTTGGTTTGGATTDTTTTGGNTTGETTNETGETNAQTAGNDEGGNGGVDEGDDGGDDEGESWRKRSLNVIHENDDEIMNKIAKEIENKIKNGQGKINLNLTDKEKRGLIHKRQEEEEEDEAADTTTNTDNGTGTNNAETNNNSSLEATYPGCKKFVVDKVKSGITPLYIIFFIFLIDYVIIFVSSIFYWLDLRSEKEYNEFN